MRSSTKFQWGEGDCPFIPLPTVHPRRVIVDIQTLETTYANANNPDCAHEIEFSNNGASDAAKMRATDQKMKVWSRSVNAKPATAAVRRSTSSEDINGFLDWFRSKDLMDPLTGKPVLIGDLLQAAAGAALRQNVLISLGLGLRPGLQWTPLPSGNQAERLDPFIGEMAGPVTLPHVSDPRTKFDLLAIEDLDVNRRDVWVALSNNKVRESRHVLQESFSIIHEVYNNKNNPEPQPPITKSSVSFLYGGGKDRNGR